MLKKPKQPSPVTLFPCKEADKQETSASVHMLILSLVRTRYKFYATLNMGKHYKAVD